MFKKFTFTVAFFASFQLTEVAQGSELCAISLYTTQFTCNFPSKNQTECHVIEKRITEKFDCFLKTGNGCSTLYNRCTQFDDFKFNEYCAELKGVNNTNNNMNAPRVCAPIEFKDESKDYALGEDDI